MVSQIELLCAACGKTFTRSVKSHNQRVSRGAKQFFCSTACVLDKKRREEHQCEFCGTATFNPKFCSQSCSASRRLGIQRNPPKLRVCLACGGEFLMSGTHRSPKYCPPCKGSNTWPTVDLKRPHIRRGSRYFTRPDYKNVTIEQICQGPYLTGKHKSHLHIYIRALNRTWNKAKLKLPCAVCGYSAHVELAHIQPISSFSPDTLLGVVNATENVIQLCPNHHWELDSGVLKLKTIGAPERN